MMKEKFLKLAPTLAIYLAIVLVISIRIYSDPLHYTSVDSIEYLKEAERINRSKSLSILNYSTLNEAFTTWPIGYPVLVAVSSALTNTTLLMASKLLNFVFLGLILILLYKWFGDKSWFICLYFFSYGILEIFSHTWSDGPFLFFVILLAYVVYKDFSIDYDKFLFLKLSTCLVCLFLLRYAGIFYFFFIAAFLIRFFIKKDVRRIKQYLFALTISSTVVFAYFFNNKIHSGYYFGIGRSDGGAASFSPLMDIMQGTLNEFTIARNYYFTGIDYLYIFLIIVQLFIVYQLFRNKHYIEKPTLISNRLLIPVLSGLVYFSILILLRFTHIITEFNFRILAPASTLFYIAFFAWCLEEKQKTYFVKVKPWVIAFMVLSLIMNLPKHYILNLISEYI